MTDYNYSISTNFPNGFNPAVDSGKLSSQIIADPSITTFLLSIAQDSINPDNVIITFITPLSPTEVTALNLLVANFVPDPVGNYVIIDSTLADNQALQLLASNPVGGILMQAGTGGIAVTTTNAFLVTAAAQSGITTSAGNLVLDATTALVNIDGGSGINIGVGSITGPVNIATGGTAHVTSIGNNVGTSAINVVTGSGGFNVNGAALSLNGTGASSNFTVNSNADGQDLTFAVVGATDSSIKIDSQGTGVDAASINSAGGIQLFSNSVNNHPISIVSNTNISNAITLDTNSGGGGIILSAGSFGMALNVAPAGVIGIGNFSGGDIYFSTAGAARNIFFGTDAAAIVRYQRFGKGLLESNPTPIDLSSAASPLTMAYLSSRILFGNPTGVVGLVLPTPVDVVTYFPSVAINDSFDFTVINGATVTGSYTLNAGSQTVVGSAIILPGTSGLFRIRLTNITFPTQTYILYRIS